MSKQEVDMVTLLSGVIHLIQQPQEDGEELSVWVLEEAMRIRDELLAQQEKNENNKRHKE